MSLREHRFIFDWRKTSWDYRLPLLVGIALLAHILCFYVFHVVYPTTTSLLPPSAQVTILDPNNARDRNFLSWIEMNDPAQVSAPRFNSRLVSRLTPPYKPIFSTLSPELINTAPTGPSGRNGPSIFSAESFLPMRNEPVDSRPVRSFPSRLEIGDTLEKRGPASLGQLPSTNVLLEPTSIFVGISPDGDTQFVFPLRSCGNRNLDSEVEQYVRALKFLPGPALTWGVLTLRWGGPDK
jgi:hypothetical protein